MADFRVCVAESCTGGNIPALITKNSGVSQWFAGGVCAYNIDIKEKVLGVSREIAEPCNCVSQEVAGAMSSGVRKLYNATISVSTTGYVGSNDIQETPFCFISVDSDYGITIKRFEPKTKDNDGKLYNREKIQELMAREAIRVLYTHFVVFMDKYLYNKNYKSEQVIHFIKIMEELDEEEDYEYTISETILRT